MAVTYKKLFKLLIDRDLKKQDLAEKAIAEKSLLIANALLCRIYRRMKAGS